MQLNNLVTGKIIIIDSKNITLSGIAYYQYENSIEATKNNIQFVGTISETINKKVLPDPLLTIEENELKLAYNLILEKAGLTGFEISEDPKNWKFLIEPNKEIIRVFVPNELILNAMQADEGTNLYLLSELILGMRSVVKQFAVKTENYTVQYLKFLLTEHKAILDLFPEILIEYYEN